MPQIPLPQSNTDIFSYGFSPNLNRDGLVSMQSPVVYNPIDGAVNSGSISSGANLNISSLQSSNTEKYIAPGDDIQAAIDSVFRAGGGKVFFSPGKYMPNAPIIGRSLVDLIGDHQSNTIIDFNSSPYNITYVSSSVYATGTITSITNGVSVVGSGTTWIGNVTPSHQIFIGNTWYKIASVDTNTTLTLAEGYQGNASLPGASYRAALITRDVSIMNMTLKNSAGTALSITDARNFNFGNLKLDTNNKGAVMTNISEFLSLTGVIANNSTSNGIEITNARICNFYSMATPSNGGTGAVLTNFTTGVYSVCASDANASGGISMTNCSSLRMDSIETSANTGKGLELVSGNDDIVVTDIISNANSSDNVKFTATNTNCIMMMGNVKNGGGWGVNIAANTNSTIIISANIFYNNSSGSLNNQGISTIARGNQGTADI